MLLTIVLHCSHSSCHFYSIICVDNGPYVITVSSLHPPRSYILFLHHSYIILTLFLHQSYIILTSFLHRSYTVYTIPTLFLHRSYSILTSVLHCSYIILTSVLHCSYIILTSVLHCSYIILTSFLHCLHHSYIVPTQEKIPLPGDSVDVLLPLTVQKGKHFAEKFSTEDSTTFWYQDEKGIVSYSTINYSKPHYHTLHPPSAIFQ